jgi:iron complex transport system substrate-binding protein
LTTHPIRRLVAILAVAALAAACGGDDTATDATTSTTATPAEAPAEFPVSVEADNGNVEIAAAPERIVSVSASVTEVLFALGAGPQVIAVDQHSDFPADAPVTDLSGFRPNIEAIGGYEPDLVVVASDRDGVVDALTAVGIPVLVLSSPPDLDALYDHVEVLGTATGHAAEATDLVEDIRTDLDELAASVPEREAPLPYLYELSDDLHSATSDTFIGSVLRLAGLVSIADGVDDAAGGYPQLTAEHVLQSDPALILLAHTDGSAPDLATVAARPGWSDLAAVRAGNVVVLDADIASRWGPRVVDLLRTVIDATNDLEGP